MGEFTGGVMCGLGLWLALALAVAAAPLPPPDLTQCQEGYFYPANISISCCPVLPERAVKRFSWEEYEGKKKAGSIRVRRPLHRLDEEYWEKYDRAYRLLNQLPDDDPRSHHQQRLMHCAYCDASLPLPWTLDPDAATTPFLNPAAANTGDNNETVQIHFSWLLLPWHRWFLYFHERILASLLGDEEFALPFWNWDNQLLEAQFSNAPNAIPAQMLSPAYPYLSRATRTSLHLPPALLDLRFDPFSVPLPLSPLSDSRLRQNNLAILHQALVSGATRAELFFGRPVRAGEATHHALTEGGQGTLEAGPHDVVHLWTGSEETRDYADMGTFYYSVRDPIFFAHHANLDRLWMQWKNMGGGRKDLDDPDFLDTQFLFYDENKDLVQVRVGDALHTSRLGYTYEQVAQGDALWISFNATPCSNFQSPSHTLAWLRTLPNWHHVKNHHHNDNPLTFRVKRPKPPNNQQGDVEEVLVLEGVEVDWSKPSRLEMYLMLPNATSANDCEVTCAEFVGMLAMVPNLKSHRIKKKVTFKLGIGHKLKQLSISSHLTHVALTLLPSSPFLKIKKIKITYQT